jgi:hypothetical protein
MPARAAPSVTVDQERLRPEASSGFDNGLGGGKNFELGRAIFWPSCPQTALRIAQPKRKGPPERPMVPKAQWLLLCLASWLRTDWLAAAGLMLALHWPSGPWPLDIGPVGRLSLSALVRYRHSSLLARDGARRPFDQPPSIQHPIPYMVQTKHAVPARNLGQGNCQTAASKGIVARPRGSFGD